MRKRCSHAYDDIISIENLLEAWEEFVRGKRKRKDVQEFEQYLMRNVISLHNDLKNKIYKHGEYEAFAINDPKPRNIHKASVRDRLLHHALYRVLYPFFDTTFTAHSYSCRKNKGTHKAIEAFTSFGRKVSNNHTKTVWVLKCDIRKFFANIDHEILKEILKQYVADEEVLRLLYEVIDSFSVEMGKGLPLGNLTSQLLVNIYMNKFDQFVKHRLKAKYYIRYADDFVIMSRDREWLEGLVFEISEFLWEKLKLSLHPDKVSIQTIASGIDFLGWIHFPDHRVIRAATKRRMLRSLSKEDVKESTMQSYLGLLNYGSAYRLRERIMYNEGILRK